MVSFNIDNIKWKRCVVFCCAPFFIRRKGTIFKELQINESITDKEMLLIDENGQKLGVMPRAEALRIADFRNLDLVNISPSSKPVVCKIMDYGKYRFEMLKKDKEAKKSQTQKIVKVKEIKLSQTIDVGDINTRLKQTRKFLEEGDKVKVSIKMFGRQMAHPEISVQVLEDFFEKLTDVAVLEKKPTGEGRITYMMLAPIAKK